MSKTQTQQTHRTHNERALWLKEHILPIIPRHGWHMDAITQQLTTQQQEALYRYFPFDIEDMLHCLNDSYDEQTLCAIREKQNNNTIKGTTQTLSHALHVKITLLCQDVPCARKTASLLARHPTIAHDMHRKTIPRLWSLAQQTISYGDSRYVSLNYIYTTALLYAQTAPSPSALDAFIIRRLNDVTKAASLFRQFTSS
ncbi:MAG: hypothetical protein GDA54_01335 [Alphaproteobacteria bacterium GM7ARS4]|nr:hypothetical protein [Alphaproteobacteria bacterium GM7ARS4]